MPDSCSTSPPHGPAPGFFDSSSLVHSGLTRRSARCKCSAHIIQQVTWSWLAPHGQHGQRHCTRREKRAQRQSEAGRACSCRRLLDTCRHHTTPSARRQTLPSRRKNEALEDVAGLQPARGGVAHLTPAQPLDASQVSEHVCPVACQHLYLGGGGQASRRWGGQGRSLAHVCRRAGMVGTQTAMLCNAPLLRSPSPGSWPGPPRSRCSTPERPAARRGRPAGKQRAARELVCVRRRTTAGFVEIALGGGQRTESIHPVWHQPSPLKYNGAPRTMGHPAQDQLWSPGGDHITHVVPAPSPSPLAPRAFL